jgi:E3 ubiquitin-protein ligase HERC2
LRIRPIFSRKKLSICSFLKSVLLFRLHEFDQAVAAVREGMARVVPVPLFSLFTGFELETMVCGSPEIPIHLLKSVATYKVMKASVLRMRRVP